MPPELQCIRNDTLIYSPPINQCASLEGYVVFYSEFENGPYSILDSINNPNQLVFPITGLDEHYFYMESIMSCPFAVPQQSDTLTNGEISFVPIRNINSIDDNVAVIEWFQSEHPNFDSYQLYTVTNQGTQLLYSGRDTMFSHVHNDSDQTYRYLITVSDACGTQSIFSPVYSTIRIQFENEVCNAQVRATLEGNNSTLSSTTSYQIIRNLGSDTDTLLMTRDPSILILDTLSNNENYCLYAQILDSQSSLTLTSNLECLTTNFDRLRNLQCYHISHDPINNPSISYYIDSDVMLNSLNLYNDKDQELQNLLPIDRFFNTIDLISSAQGSSYYIQAEDPCQTNPKTSPIAPPYIRGEISENNRISLDFTDAMIPDGASYLRSEWLASGQSTDEVVDSYFVDTQWSYQLIEDSVCLYNQVHYQYEDEYIADTFFISRSNTLCFVKYPTIFFPNGFIPDGINQTFRPQGVNLDSGTFTMRIYNRYGEEIFTTTDEKLGWDGRGQPAGSYMFLVEYITPSGQEIIKHGNVQLIR